MNNYKDIDFQPFNYTDDVLNFEEAINENWNDINNLNLEINRNDDINKKLIEKIYLFFLNNDYKLSNIGEFIKRLIEGKASYDALEVLYKFPLTELSKKYKNIDINEIEKIVEKMYLEFDKLNIVDLEKIENFLILNLENAKGVRNRHKYVRAVIINSLIDTLMINRTNKKNKNIKIFSIACGSAMAVIESVAYMKRFYLKNNETIEVVLSDMFDSSIERANNYAKKMGVKIDRQYSGKKNGNIFKNKLWFFLKKENPDLIEMVGLADYLPNKFLIIICFKIILSLKKNGLFIMSNIIHNHEQYMVHDPKFVNWDTMIYKNHSDFNIIFYPLKLINMIKLDLFVEPQEKHLIAKIVKIHNIELFNFFVHNMTKFILLINYSLHKFKKFFK